jgi:hypothetical protein
MAVATILSVAGKQDRIAIAHRDALRFLFRFFLFEHREGSFQCRFGFDAGLHLFHDVGALEGILLP